jgi:hypothetical protein
MRKDGSYVKVERLSLIRKEIAKQFPNPVEVSKVELWVECNIGLTPEKARDYIDKAVAAAGWVITDGKILST